ncbi:DUF2304 family protein [Candidatus Woesearchaeota archaeon]|nr:DUF2304 family protein [Candidatus Woesearchaeota archaeon]
MEVLQIVIIIFALFAISRAVLRFKDNNLSKNELMFWVAVWVAIIILPFIPNVMTYISSIFGIGRGIDLVIYISIVVIFYLIFRLYVKIEAVEKQITLVVRKLTLKEENKKKKR